MWVPPSSPPFPPIFESFVSPSPVHILNWLHSLPFLRSPQLFYPSCPAIGLLVSPLSFFPSLHSRFAGYLGFLSRVSVANVNQTDHSYFFSPPYFPATPFPRRGPKLRTLPSAAAPKSFVFDSRWREESRPQGAFFRPPSLTRVINLLHQPLTPLLHRMDLGHPPFLPPMVSFCGNWSSVCALP